MYVKSTYFSLFVFLMASVHLNAQNQDSSFLKGLYLEAGGNFFKMGPTVGVTMLSGQNWYISARVNWFKKDAPQLPDGYYPPTSSYYDPGTSSGGCLFCVIPSFGGGGNNGDGDEDDNLKKRVKQISFSAGWMYQVPDVNLRLRAEAGVVRMKIVEPVDFEFVPANTTPGTTGGYIFKEEERNRTGIILRAGAEVILSEVLGFGLGISSSIAKDEMFLGLNAGIIIGLVE